LGLLKKQIAKRLTNLFLQQILQQFNEGLIDITEASFQLQIGRTHLYRLRIRFLRERSHFAAKLSGGDHWPTTGLSPNAAWENALAQKRAATRPCPPATLLDLHLALHLKRRVNSDHQIDFLGQSWHIAPTKRSSITLIHHPLRQFWAVTEPPSPPLNNWPEILGKYSL